MTAIITWNEGWSILCQGLDDIWGRCEEGKQWKFKSSTFYLYSTAYQMCTQATPNFSGRLYNGLMQYSNNLVSFTIAAKVIENNNPINMVRTIQREYAKYQRYVNANQKIFSCIDRQRVSLLIDAQKRIFYKKIIEPHLKTIENYLRIQISGLTRSPVNRCSNLRALKELLSEFDHGVDAWLNKVELLLKAELLADQHQQELMENEMNLLHVLGFIAESFPSNHAIHVWLTEQGFVVNPFP